MSFFRDPVRTVKDWFGHLSTTAVVVIGLLVTAGAVAGGVFTYRMYDYVQHDNDFCLSCHLMAEPFELFAASAHSGLGCKACHQPTLVERSTMGLVQILENPDSISVHAHVPNERCVTCHVEGDPEEWVKVEESAGHRVHFLSEDPVLDGLQCVECHSSSLHQFTASDETCGQSQCHSDIEVRLGKMGNYTIHCGACHAFSAVVPGVGDEADYMDPSDVRSGAARSALAPDAETCLSCHAMRVIMELPEDDPHDGKCSSCHNPHTQTTPAQAVESCANSGCHDDPMSGTSFHQGLAPGAMENCLTCHPAHDFQANGSLCLNCHSDIFQDPGRPVASGTPQDSGARVGAGPAPAAGSLEGLSAVPGLRGLIHASFASSAVLGDALSAAVPAGHPPVAAQETRRDSVRFSHGQHRDVDCLACHTTQGAHGALKITGLSDCRSCHHSTRSPVPGGCTACHADGPRPAAPYEVERTMTFTVGAPRERDLPFDHADHTTQDCATCHTQGLELSAAAVDCTSCHEEHHEVGLECRSCHVPAPPSAHSVQVHVGCAAAGCHTDLPFGGGVPRQREFCLTCHQDKVDHRRDEPDCSECHRLPPPGPNAFLNAG